MSLLNEVIVVGICPHCDAEIDKELCEERGHWQMSGKNVNEKALPEGECASWYTCLYCDGGCTEHAICEACHGTGYEGDYPEELDSEAE